MSTLIKNGRIITAEQDYVADVLVEDGKITLIGKDLNVEADTIVDAKDKYVLPGLIEVHGHMREPGLSHKGTVKTETQAAVAGGVTMILDMPNTKPPTVTKKSLRQKQVLQ